MILLQILRLLFFTVVVPVCLGAGVAAFVEGRERAIGFMWIAGQLVFMALFQALSVPVILLQEKVSFEPYGAFSVLVFCFTLFAAAGALGGVLLWLFRCGKAGKARPGGAPGAGKLKGMFSGGSPGTGGLKRMFSGGAVMDKKTVLLWAVFGAGLLAQLFLVGYLAFSDGDDAYYTAVSTVTEASDTMYLVMPYIGGATGLDTRHCLAPFPILVAFYARVSGIHPLVTANVAMPLLMIPLTYCVYGVIGSRLLREGAMPLPEGAMLLPEGAMPLPEGAVSFHEENSFLSEGNSLHPEKSWRLPAYMIFVEILILWGNYSLYTAETFLMTRSRQGKAALANMVIPAVFLVLHMIGERYLGKSKGKGALWLLTAAAMTASCLCSTLGGFLLTILLGLFGVCLLTVCRKWRILPPLLLCMIPAAVYVGLYMLLQ